MYNNSKLSRGVYNDLHLIHGVDFNINHYNRIVDLFHEKYGYIENMVLIDMDSTSNFISVEIPNSVFRYFFISQLKDSWFLLMNGDDHYKCDDIGGVMEIMDGIIKQEIYSTGNHLYTI